MTWALLGGLLLQGAAARAQLSLYTTVDLSRRNSPAVQLAEADVARATAALQQSRDAYLPSVIFGSSIGYSYGFPVGQPSVYNVQAQSLVLSFSQREYIRAARAALRTAELNLEDAVDQVSLDTAMDYIELDTVLRQLTALDEEKRSAERLMNIEQQRVAAGLESRMGATRAELNAAQADLRRLDLEAEAELLREKLAHLTGLSPASMVPQAETIPGEPMFAQGGATLGLKNASVEAGFANAVSKHYVARGDNRQNYRPQISLGVNYSRYAEFNNYAEYYLRFQHNNFDVGLQMQLPFFDATKRAQARGSAADAVHADAQAAQARDIGEEQMQQLRGSLRELRAQERVARLQNDLAQQQLESVETQLAGGAQSVGAPALSPADQMLAQIAERQRYTQVLDAHLQLMRAELGLLRATGGLADWLNTPPHTP
ncbi:MAG TPA: TolC family protein [Acidobacteriaceae bacterium]